MRPLVLLMRLSCMAALAIAVLIPTVAGAALVKKDVSYKEGETLCDGYLVYDDELVKADAKAPGIVLVHDWMGLGEFAKSQADRTAALGYVVLACDIYGHGVRPANSKEAGAEAGKYKADRALLRKRVNAAVDFLKAQPNVDAKKLGATGYCFGGTTVLELARSGADVAGVVSFHGGLDSPTPADGLKIKSKVLVCHGAVDPFISPEDFAAFKKEMDEAKVDYQIIEYGGAVHSFTHPGADGIAIKGAKYDEKADRRSWTATKAFFAEVFGAAPATAPAPKK